MEHQRFHVAPKTLSAAACCAIKKSEPKLGTLENLVTDVKELF